MNLSVGFQPAFGGGHASRKKPRTGQDAEFRLYHEAQENREHPEYGVHGPKINVLVLQQEIPDIHPSRRSHVFKTRM